MEDESYSCENHCLFSLNYQFIPPFFPIFPYVIVMRTYVEIGTVLKLYM